MMIQSNQYLYSIWVPSYLPKEAIHQKEKKLSGSFWEINIFSEKLTTTDDEDGRRRTTDESSKLRCLSAGGAKNRSKSLIFKLIQGYGGMHHWVKFCVNRYEENLKLSR